MREFIVGKGGGIVPDTVKQEPPIGLSGNPLLAEWLNANADSVLDGSYELPETYAGQPLLAGSSFVPFTFLWDVPGVATNVRDRPAILRQAMTALAVPLS